MAETIQPEPCLQCKRPAAGHPFHWEVGQPSCLEYVRPSTATLAQHADALFGRRRWHSLFTRIDEFTAGQQCNVDQCDKLTTKRIIVNIWGSVAQYDTCDEHAERYHAKCMDDFPLRREWLPPTHPLARAQERESEPARENVPR